MGRSVRVVKKKIIKHMRRKIKVCQENPAKRGDLLVFRPGFLTLFEVYISKRKKTITSIM